MKKKILSAAGIIVAFLLVSYGFVPQVLSGKIVNQSDISGWQGMSREMMVWNSSNPDNQTAWTESMFGGMPTTTIHASTKGDWTQAIYDVLLKGKRPATYFFISLVGAFLLLLSLGVSPLLAAGGAIAVTFCSYNLQIIQVGHNTKMQAIAFLPWVLSALVFTYRKAASLPLVFLGSAAFGLFVSFQVKANHPQISYYLALMILLYAVVLFVCILREKKKGALRNFFVASAFLLITGCVGIGTNAIKLLPTKEYTPYSMRGGSTAVEKNGEKASKGLDLDYATAWSYGWEELPNMLIANYNGGSSAGSIDPDKSATCDLLKKAGQKNVREISRALPLYWGPQPFTAGPMYMGSVTIFLFILGLCCYRGKERWWIIICTLLAVLLALGNHFMLFTKFFYNCVPLYNKFRTVSMSLVVLQFTLPMLGFLVLDKIAGSVEKGAALRRDILLAGGISLGICLVLAIGMSLFGSFTSDSDSGMQEALAAALGKDREHLMWADTFRSMAFIAAAASVLLWGVSSARTGNRMVSSVIVCALVLLDLFPMGKRFLNADHFVTKRNFQNQFALRPCDEAILKDTDPSYRVLDLSVNVFNDSHPSYWHKNIGGYSPAKLQIYQEFIESTLTPEINTLYKALGGVATIGEAEQALPYLPGLAKMNTRYIIVGDKIPPVRYRYARGNAWFDGDDAGQDSVELTSYAPNELHYRYSSASGGKLVFSEVYYPAGWTLRLEDTGEELAIGMHESLLRSAVVPAGEHTLVMRFDPPSYRIGENVSRASSAALLLLVLLSLSVTVKNKKKKIYGS